MTSGARQGGNARSDRPSPIDVHVGSRLRLRRALLGISQHKLGDALGLTFQQVQKYERGANRVSASRLYEIALALSVPISFFFEELPASSDEDLRPFHADVLEALVDGDEFDRIGRRETLELVRAYYRISDPKVRRRLVDLTKVLSHSPAV